MLQAIYMEIINVVPFDIAFVMQKEENWPGTIKLTNLYANDTVHLSVGERYNYEGSVIDRVMKQNANLTINDTSSLTNETDRSLFADLGHKA